MVDVAKKRAGKEEKKRVRGEGRERGRKNEGGS